MATEVAPMSASSGDAKSSPVTSARAAAPRVQTANALRLVQFDDGKPTPPGAATARQASARVVLAAVPKPIAHPIQVAVPRRRSSGQPPPPPPREQPALASPPARRNSPAPSASSTNSDPDALENIPSTREQDAPAAAYSAQSRNSSSRASLTSYDTRRHGSLASGSAIDTQYRGSSLGTAASAPRMRGATTDDESRANMVQELALFGDGSARPASSPIAHTASKESSSSLDSGQQQQQQQAAGRDRITSTAQPPPRPQSKNIQWAPDENLVHETRAKTMYAHSESAMKWRARKESFLGCFRRGGGGGDGQDEE
jgi:hypothetical protein